MADRRYRTPAERAAARIRWERHLDREDARLRAAAVQALAAELAARVRASEDRHDRRTA